MKTGILGGTFDPPHRGHLRLARLAQRALGLDRVLFVPCARQPLKSGGPVASAPDRCAMVALALQGRADWLLDTREAVQEGASYTVETLEALRAERPGDALVLLLGQDSLESLPRWRRARRILALAILAVAPRDPSRPVALPEGRWGADVRLLPVAPWPVSSSEIRGRIARRAPWKTLVPAPVARYILRQGLYRPAGGRCV